MKNAQRQKSSVFQAGFGVGPLMTSKLASMIFRIPHLTTA
jgi:hypothetical protein